MNRTAKKPLQKKARNPSLQSLTKPSLLFPQGHAIGMAFCNREKERAALKESFLNNEHAVIVAPRRYGKSSLVKQVLLDTKLPGKRIDLLPATNALFLYKAIKSAFSELINQIAPKSMKAKQKLIEFIKELNPKLTLSLFGQTLEVSTPQTPESSILDLLLGLNVAAQKVNQRIVLCFDEFQQVGQLKNNHAIEASIRHAVEISTNVTYVFSGSSRHLLSQMFNTKNRPLYHLCDLITLDRIKAETYLSIIRERAQQRWGEMIKENMIKEIINLTKCHSYYVNALCRRLWKLDKKPTVQIVQKTWLDYIDTQSNWISDDLGRLSPNQRNILAALAFQPTTEPHGNEFSERVKIGVSSIQKSLRILLKNDFVYKNKERQYRVLDPAMETYLHHIRYFDFIEE